MLYNEVLLKISVKYDDLFFEFLLSFVFICAFSALECPLRVYWNTLEFIKIVRGSPLFWIFTLSTRVCIIFQRSLRWSKIRRSGWHQIPFVVDLNYIWYRDSKFAVSTILPDSSKPEQHVMANCTELVRLFSPRQLLVLNYEHYKHLTFWWNHHKP